VSDVTVPRFNACEFDTRDRLLHVYVFVVYSVLRELVHTIVMIDPVLGCACGVCHYFVL
jgi:hypothetical protein